MHAPRFAVTLAVTLALVGGVGATVVEPLTFAEASARADVVVHGRVMAVQSAWHPTRAVIHSTATVEIEAVLAGAVTSDAALDERLSIRWLGGRVGPVEQRVPGGATLAVGDEVVVCLRRVGAVYAIVGQRQGVVHIEPAPDDGLRARPPP